MKAIVVDATRPHRLALHRVTEPALGPHDVLVGIERVALHPSDLDGMRTAQNGVRVGRDFAGRVLRRAEDGTGPAVGARVVGTCVGGACAERHASPVTMLAEVPDSVALDEVVCSPLPWLAAWVAIRRVGFGFGRRLLVLDAESAVGQYACQLGYASGLRTSAVVREATSAPWVRAHGLEDVRVEAGGDAGADRPGALPGLQDLSGEVDVVVDSLSRHEAGALTGLLVPGGVHVDVDLSTRIAGEDAGLAAERDWQGPARVTARPMEDARAGPEAVGVILSRLLKSMMAGQVVTPLGTDEPSGDDEEVARLIDAGSSLGFLAGIRIC